MSFVSVNRSSQTGVTQYHYRLSKWCEDYDVVFRDIVISVADNVFTQETFIFPASATGKVISFYELLGSRKGVHDADKIFQEFVSDYMESYLHDPHKTFPRFMDEV